MKFGLRALVLASLVTSGCASVEDPSVYDTSFDTALDTATDLLADTLVDTAVDTVADSLVDVPADTTTDTGVDTATDTGIDTGIDTTTDTGVDTGIDTTTDTGIDTGIDTTADTGVDPGTDPGGCAAALAAFAYDFDTPASCSAWTHAVWSGSGCGSYDSWECGSVSGWPNNPSGSTGSLGTDLDGWPLNNECSWIASPIVDLSACSGSTVWLEFQVAYSLEVVSSSCHDAGFVAVNSIAGWTLLEGGYDHPCSGCHHLVGEYGWCALNRDWFNVRVNVSAYMNSTFQIRYAVEYDDGYPWSGLFIDDVRLELIP